MILGKDLFFPHDFHGVDLASVLLLDLKDLLQAHRTSKHSMVLPVDFGEAKCQSSKEHGFMMSYLAKSSLTDNSQQVEVCRTNFGSC